jgi:transmembrane sensor
MYRQDANDIEAEATHWIMRLDREGDNVTFRAQLETWLAQDTRRRGALLRAEAAWAMLDRLAVPTGDEVAPMPRREGPRRGGVSRRALIGAGGAIAAAAALGFVVPWSRNRYQTTVGEIRRLPLPDGSTAAINTATQIEAHMASDARNISLAYGEAWFQVAKDPRRPFTVRAGSIFVKAVGTAFSVYRKTASAEVLVTEGAVEAWVDGARGAGVRLTAGESALISDDAAVSKDPIQPSKIDQALAWRSGMIDLAGMTLSDAVTQFNRYNRRHLVIADQSLANEEFFGIFRIDDAEGFANAVHQSLGAKVSFADRSVIVLGQSKK